MKAEVDTETIDELWQRFKSTSTADGDAITDEGLRRLMQSLGHDATSEELHHILRDAESSGRITYDQFVALIASRHGDLDSRLKAAFEVFDHDGDGLVTPDAMRVVLQQFGLTEEELVRIFEEADGDGDGAITFEEFSALLPRDENPTVPHYRDSHVFATGEHGPEVAVPSGDAVLQPAAPRKPAAALERTPRHRRGEPGCGTSRLQMQIGLFRLLQGAAYRSFRENYSANVTTHLRAKTLPYTITDFVPFVETAIEFYKALDVVEQACFPVLDRMSASLEGEQTRLQQRIEHWATIPKTPEMLVTAQAMQERRSQATTAREKFAAGVEFALTLRRKNLQLADVVEELVAVHELNRLRRLELHQELAQPSVQGAGEPAAYLSAWNRVLLSSADEAVDGAMMPAAYWYQDFMPKLLAACSVATADDVATNKAPDEASLDRWFEAAVQSGAFDRYGSDVSDHFMNCTPQQKLALQQAWRLSQHYLNGVQKRRERLEYGRETGFLSQYVAFIDVYLGRNDVRDAQMRLSFPYYLGPATWRFFHTAAEIICGQDTKRQREMVGLFKKFFKHFAKVYPCPYCRYHLNYYVVQNREVEMYPVEYLMLGRHGDTDDLTVDIDQKLAAITDGPTLRLFLWKLHNSVSASIARTEPWYHRDQKAFYTTRHWPSLDSELARSRTFQHDSIPLERVARIYGLLKPAARLAALRGELQRAHRGGNADGLQRTFDEARPASAELDAALAAGRFLERTYTFDPLLQDDAPHFTPEEEVFARGGVFVQS